MQKFESIVIGALIIMLAAVVFFALIDLAWFIIRDVLKPPIFIVDVDDLLGIFGFILLVIIGLKLLETIKLYYVEGRIELKVIFTAALIALGRKIIILEPEKYDGLTLIGIGVIILALVFGYFVVSSKNLAYKPKRVAAES